MAVFFTFLKLFAFFDEFLFSLGLPRRLSTVIVATNLRSCEPIESLTSFFLLETRDQTGVDFGRNVLVRLVQ